jgi:hypothetical protein
MPDEPSHSSGASISRTQTPGTATHFERDGQAAVPYEGSGVGSAGKWVAVPGFLPCLTPPRANAIMAATRNSAKQRSRREKEA